VVVRDGWPSGLRRTIGNRVGLRPRGFESHPVRWLSRSCRRPESVSTAGLVPVGQGSRLEVGSVWVVGYGAWLSPVERCVRVAEVPGSNPGAPMEVRKFGCIPPPQDSASRACLGVGWGEELGRRSPNW